MTRCDVVDFTYLKTTWTTRKNIVWLKKYLMMTSFFNIMIKTYWIDMGQPGFTCQIHNPSYET
jgi:hypothetical protein